MSDENWLDIDHEKLFYRKDGSGPSVVFIHGFAEDGTIWDKQVDFLKKNFRLIIPDLPGSGKSAFAEHQLPDIHHRSMDDYADSIKRILDKEKISSCAMVGNSMGGYITLAFAEEYPDLLNAFTLFHSTAYADTKEKKVARKKSIEFIKKYGTAEFIKQSSPNLFSEFTKSCYPEMVQEIIHRYDNFNSEALVSYYEAMILRPDRTDVLQDFKKPIQFIIGEGDNAVPLNQSLSQCHLPKFSYIHILENTGHMGMWEATNTVNDLLLSFLNQVLV